MSFDSELKQMENLTPTKPMTFENTYSLADELGSRMAPMTYTPPPGSVAPPLPPASRRTQSSTNLRYSLDIPSASSSTAASEATSPDVPRNRPASPGIGRVSFAEQMTQRNRSNSNVSGTRTRDGSRSPSLVSGSENEESGSESSSRARSSSTDRPKSAGDRAKRMSSHGIPPKALHEMRNLDKDTRRKYASLNFKQAKELKSAASGIRLRCRYLLTETS